MSIRCFFLHGESDTFTKNKVDNTYSSHLHTPTHNIKNFHLGLNTPLRSPFTANRIRDHQNLHSRMSLTLMFIAILQNSAGFEEAFCFGAGNAVHIDVARVQKREVAVSHIQLKARQVSIILGVKACVGVAKNILNLASAKARIIADFTPTALPVCRADFFFF